MLIHSFSIFFFNKPLHFLFLWQFKLVFGYEKPVVHAGQSILHKRMISLGAKQNAHRRVVSLGHYVLFVPAYIGIELADVFMAEFLDFQFHQHMALENAVISLFPAVRIWKSVISEYADRLYTTDGKGVGIWLYSTVFMRLPNRDDQLFKIPFASIRVHSRFLFQRDPYFSGLLAPGRLP